MSSGEGTAEGEMARSWSCWRSLCCMRGERERAYSVHVSAEDDVSWPLLLMNVSKWEDEQYGQTYQQRGTSIFDRESLLWTAAVSGWPLNLSALDDIHICQLFPTQSRYMLLT